MFASMSVTANVRLVILALVVIVILISMAIRDIGLIYDPGYILYCP